jgi:hypothetical protein
MRFLRCANTERWATYSAKVVDHSAAIHDSWMLHCARNGVVRQLRCETPTGLQRWALLYVRRLHFFDTLKNVFLEENMHRIMSKTIPACIFAQRDEPTSDVTDFHCHLHFAAHLQTCCRQVQCVPTMSNWAVESFCCTAGTPDLTLQVGRQTEKACHIQNRSR